MFAEGGRKEGREGRSKMERESRQKGSRKEGAGRREGAGSSSGLTPGGNQHEAP